MTVNGTALAAGVSSAKITLDQGSNIITLVVTAEDSVTTSTYIIDVTRQTAASLSQRAYIKASNTGERDYFGSGLAMDGDTLVVGAFGEWSNATGINGDQANNDAINSGALYAFVRDASDMWSQQAYIKASNTERADQLGFGGLAFDDDTLVVGAHAEGSSATGINGDQADNSASYSGAVYVFTRDASDVWSQQAYIKASNTNADDQFGTSVALDGDTLVVGAGGESSSATGIDGDQSDNSVQNAGAVYVFTRDASDVWSQQAYIKASNTDALDFFGANIALDGDTLVVGIVGEDSSATGIDGDQSDNSADRAGAVYVFTRDASDVWSQQAYIKASNTEALDFFGAKIALDGDSLVVGAVFEDSSATGINGDQADNNADRSGAVYVFTRDASDVWSQQAYIKASNTDATDFFGHKVALDGDALAIGALLEASSATGIDGDQSDNSAHQAGAVYVFTRDASDVWSQQAYIKASNTGAGDNFGISIVLEGDTLAVGAHVEASNATGIDGDQSDNSLPNAGAVYVFE